ncbi:hypothetical protein HY768_09810 [candidate division TA06 bacterium]|uniref:Uncharacterized protein n=1 Tax=candidate division TA06 bacterium TaxID=2250710 RepID=A0A933MLH2_UNCT6|nr:hypothetical protein [candidate division TA06 bacterium]
MKNDNNINNQDRTTQKLLQLVGSWQVEMPEDRFFINLPVMVEEKVKERPSSWWQKGWIYWGALSGAMTAAVLLFAWQLGTGISADGRLARAASEWGLDDYGWERVDEVLVQSGQVAQQQNQLSASFQTYGSEVLMEYSVSEQDDYQSATQDLSDEEWQDVLEQISAKERTI